ncbi:MAG TPA: TVP38/TMEM64 family protein [Nitrospirales bacterium]|nr:TVP38/TMEM64 family protein [Nitrospirales bacterium]HIA14830.1 TVP38/TMEM64 family protein [Nitrospirales bacterium]HIC04018.1 TVP38/TMEM64 family protein [Nitrospirales bacterium]HIN33891.1 TVP38/TMEM64 family protein [Nitrospirales bacterium]HIO68958.1 TVP38/TMEM64 family protein [Nitrospirales bacterium]
MTDASHTKSAVGKIGLLLLVATGIGIFIYFDVLQYLTLESLKTHRTQLLAYTEEHYSIAVMLFVLLYCIQTALSLPGATILTLGGGLLFGSVLGALYVNIAATSGATLAFLTVRYLLHDWVERKFGHRLEPLHRGFSKNAFSYLLTLRLVPLFPFFLVNMVSGLTRIRLSRYVLATSIGILPGSFVYTNAGRQLGMIDSLGEIASLGVLGAFALLALFALLPIIYRRFSGNQAEDGVKQ